jgi:DNA modification methylase
MTQKEKAGASFRAALNGNAKNDLQELDAPIHRWWRFVLAFPPHLVSQYLDEFGCEGSNNVVFDPFSGTGTTLVEAKRRRCHAVGMEALDFCYLASKVKTTWDVSIGALEKTAEVLLDRIGVDFSRYGFFSGKATLFQTNRNAETTMPCNLALPAEQQKLLGKGYISPRPLQKLLAIQQHVLALPAGPVADFFKLALGSTAVAASNVGFGPEIYRKKEKEDEDVWAIFSGQVEMMLSDLREVQRSPFGRSDVYHHDSRDLSPIGNIKIDVVITSPPYPNEKNYSRITRIENLITNCVQSRTDLKRLKKGLIRSNSQNIYKGDQDDQFVKKFTSIQKIAEEIEQRRISMGKTSGFERLYAKVTKHYFGGMYRHLLALKPLMKRGGRCAYVVGDQMSYLMVHIKTGEILAELAEDIGYKVVKIDLWRERWATASRTPIREEVVVFARK